MWRILTGNSVDNAVTSALRRLTRSGALGCLLTVTWMAVPDPVLADGSHRVFECRPAHAVFCRNIHVSCSGVTDIPTTAFRVSIVGTDAAIDFDGSAPLVPGRVSGAGDLVIRLLDDRDWIRIEADGRYSHRIHWSRGSARETAMSRGRCVPAGP